MRITFTSYNASIARCYTPRLGTTKKYYCGRKLDCGCCSGICGPLSGCNCVNCMKLDLKSRNLSKGWLVNRDGVKAKKGSTGHFYCGQHNLVGTPNCDGYCGPNNGPNCSACKKLDALTKAGGIYRCLI